ncbi:MAG TPA: shikimate kinase, partial [Clostridia bacterium]|nr:shikimate kinase [Clostridia bacterium]
MKKYGLLGRKLGHSYSPIIHSFLGKYEYALYEREPEQLNEFFSDSTVSGFNVTIPYKKDALKYCKIITSIAERTKCVNTVIRKNGNYLLGENTDYYGFMYMIKKSKIAIEGK